MRTRTKKVSLLAALMGAMMMLLASCTTVLEGTVIDKVHTPSYQEAYQTCVMYDTDNPGVCKQYVTNFRTVPADWSVQISGTNTDGEQDYATYSISETVWNNTDNGDYMRFDDRGNLVEHVEKLR